ncbi:MAG: hypothetical protein ACP5JO_01300 [Candidatus Ratteibacteria bacterium]
MKIKEKNKIKIGEDNTIFVNGKPFFPIGLWKLPGINEPYLCELKKNGFNLFMTVYEKEDTFFLLNLAEKYNFKVIIGACGNWYKLICQSENISEYLEKEKHIIKEEIQKYRNHAALFGYFIADEPVWTKTPLNPILFIYQFHKKYDPSHPVYMNHAPRNKIEELAEYNKACDITGADIYPVPAEIGHSDLQDKTVSCVGKYTEKMRASVENKKPVWMTLQGFSWAHFYNLKNEGKYPTFEEMKFMCYDSIVHGAKGIFFWGTHYIAESSFWKTIFRISSEIGSISHILTSKTIFPSQVKIENDDIVLLHKVYNGKDYLIAINEKNNKYKVNFQTNFFDSQLQVVFENRAVTLNNGIFSDVFLPYEVHIYTNDDNLPFALFSRPEIYIDKRGIIAKTEFLSNFPIYEGEANWIGYPQKMYFPGKEVFFRKTFNLGEDIILAELMIVSYGNHIIYLNGKKIPHKNLEWNIMCRYDITSYVKKGENILAIQLLKKDILPQTLMLEIELTTTSKNKTKIISDTSFLVTDIKYKGWYNQAFNDSNWKKAEINKTKRIVQRIIPYNEILKSDLF